MTDTRGGADALAILGAAAVGALLGAATALLLAPKAGAELREELRTAAQSAVEKIHDVAEQVTEQVKAAGAEMAENSCDEPQEPQAPSEAE